MCSHYPPHDDDNGNCSKRETEKKRNKLDTVMPRVGLPRTVGLFTRVCFFFSSSVFLLKNRTYQNDMSLPIRQIAPQSIEIVHSPIPIYLFQSQQSTPKKKFSFFSFEIKHHTVSGKFISIL